MDSLRNYLNSIAVAIDCIHCFYYLKMLLVVIALALLLLHTYIATIVP